MAYRLSLVLGAVAAAAFTTGAAAGPCDYKPSKLAGKAGAAMSSGVKAGATAAVDGARAAGHYALTNPVSGLAMAGTAAETASGFAAGAAGVAGTVGAIVTAPVTLTVGAVTLGAAGAYEGVCYFSVERVTDEDEVRRILENIALNDPDIGIAPDADGDRLVLTRDGEERSYLVRKLYIADGVLKHRDWGPNTDLGEVAYVAPEAAE